LIGVDEFNQTFFDKIDQIEIDISNNLDLDTILKDTDIKKIQVSDFRYTYDKSDIEKKIFEVRNIDFDILENGDDYILYKITKSEERAPDLNDSVLKEEILGLIYEKNKYEYNKKLIKKIEEGNFNNKNFVEMGNNKIKNLILNSIKDNKKFEIKAVELLYSLPLNSFTLINDDKSKIYLAKIKKRLNQTEVTEIKLKEYTSSQNTNIKNSILKSYDIFLNDKYNVDINKVAINNVENYFK
jgi:peptidyl-prolyl cis-trans isomerase D